MSQSTPTQAWQQLLSLALIGTGQSGSQVPAMEGLPMMAEGEDARERQALQTAGALSLMRKAGYIPPAAPTATAWMPYAPETIPLLGAKGQDALSLLLDHKQPALLSPYLEQVRQRGYRIPERLVPPLMELAGNQIPIKRLVLATSGERGRWLAQRHPDWSALIAPENPADVWNHGSAAERKAYLVVLRQQEPDKARELLAQSIKEVPSKELAGLLEAMATNLSAVDSPVLEPLCNAKSKEVRLAAVELLARIPEHPLTQRLFDLAKPYIQIKGHLLIGKRFEVELPATYDPAWQAVGIEAKSPRFPTERGGWLGQMLALIPPVRWSEHFKAKPYTLVDYAAKNGFANILLPAWAAAATLHQDDAWLEALLDDAFYKNDRDSFYTTFPDRAISKLPGRVMEPVMLRQMANVTAFTGPQLLQLNFGLQADPWSAGFTLKAIEWLAKVIRGMTKQHAFYSPVLIIINQMALTAHPSGAAHLDKIENELSANALFTANDHKLFMQMRATLQLRQKLAESLP